MTLISTFDQKLTPVPPKGKRELQSPAAEQRKRQELQELLACSRALIEESKELWETTKVLLQDNRRLRKK